MYHLPPDFNPAVFVGRILETVCFAAYQIDFRFDNGDAISVASALSYNDIVVEIPSTNSVFLVAIGNRVVKADKNPEGDFIVEFESGDVLKALNVEDRYESYVITCAGKEIFV